ncbi:DMT family transporter [Demequina capsici]|uniref:DMT family transporter n=1 Tax=Demequina capsici TaxID=3075620 RepID=A0AA96JDY3_9MICO|nr:MULTISPECIES: DMT family transporter [unclassified Demequina]WNM25696.1 DMT family transporter [Demequina sp. OYTSA14]WNM28591.1 DMT family transporter [Demequina sp. PMTSA13]
MTDAMTARRSPALGALFVLTGAFLFGFNGSMTKVVMQAGITPEQLTLFRVLGTAVIAGTVLAITDRAQLRLTWRDAGRFAALGIAGLAMVQWLYAVAIKHLPVGVALLFEYMAVVIVAIVARVVFKEKVHPRLWWAIGAVLVGLAIVAEVWDSTLSGVGVAAGLAAACAYAFYFISGERSVADRPPMAVAFWASAFATAFWLMFSQWWRIAPGTFAENVSFGGSLDAIHAPMWVPLVGMVALGAFAPFTLIFMSLRHISATASGILATSEVLFAFIVAWLWLGETLAPLPLVGAAVVLVGIVMAQTARERAVSPDSDDAFALAVPPEAP